MTLAGRVQYYIVSKMVFRSFDYISTRHEANIVTETNNFFLGQDIGKRIQYNNFRNAQAQNLDISQKLKTGW